MEWSPQQSLALRAVERWVKDPWAPQVFRLFGWAGTGKTTLATEAGAMVGGDVMYMTFTGKAALVLRGKGCPGASTIHSAIYKAHQDQLTGEITYHLNTDSPVGRVKLVVVDEVGMVDEILGRDLLSFGVKVLVLGDPGQLPPIEGTGFFTEAGPDVMLTEIHRQASDNPIIRMSMDLREGGALKPGAYGDSLVMSCFDLEREQVYEAGQVLVGTNKSRHKWNKRIRRARGFLGDHPAIGDRLVCLRNDRSKGLLNGSLWETQEVGLARNGHVAMTIEALDHGGDRARLRVQTPMEYFLGTEKDLHWRVRKEVDEFNFGWALTCHKAQGSQWDDVLVFDESRVFDENATKWLYTAITRAAERVTVVQD